MRKINNTFSPPGHRVHKKDRPDSNPHFSPQRHKVHRGDGIEDKYSGISWFVTTNQEIPLAFSRLAAKSPLSTPFLYPL
jgi:hypothetical protein